jgi:3-hydroxy-5-phosphonooxypentane-2,4-dione thiolase
MADLDGVNEGKSDNKEYFLGVPQVNPQFTLKGSAGYDWGMKNRLSRVFRPDTGRTVMLAFDHGYFQGPTTGLERVDQTILPLEPYCDVLMLTRGILRSIIPSTTTKSVALRVSGGPSILKELSDEEIACDIEDAVRVNAAALAVQVFIGGPNERQSVINMTRLVDQGLKVGIPVMAVTAVGRELVRNAKYFRLATRMCAELGAQFIKTYYVDEEFDTVTSCCPVPIVIAGGKKQPELDALKMCFNALREGAAGVDMGRNIFQSEAPVSMMRAVRGVVHEGLTAEKAHALYLDLSRAEIKARTGKA